MAARPRGLVSMRWESTSRRTCLAAEEVVEKSIEVRTRNDSWPFSGENVPKPKRTPGDACVNTRCALQLCCLSKGTRD